MRGAKTLPEDTEVAKSLGELPEPGPSRFMDCCIIIATAVFPVSGGPQIDRVNVILVSCILPLPFDFS